MKTKKTSFCICGFRWPRVAPFRSRGPQDRPRSRHPVYIWRDGKIVAEKP